MHTHVAHAVPGREYVEVDLDADGFQLVQLDASRSHSHYFNPAKMELGVIESWVWTTIDGEPLAESSTPILKFPIGTTPVSLLVVDNYNNSHQDTTNVTVLPSTRSGLYCYYYLGDETTFTIDTNRAAGIKPTFGHELPTVNFPTSASFPSVVNSTAFQMRCTLRAVGPAAPTTFIIQHIGPISIILNRSESIFSSDATSSETSTVELDLPEGGVELEIWYLRRARSQARLRILESPKFLHDLSSQVPIIFSLAPPNSTLEAGGLMKVFGSGLWSDPNVYFGTTPVAPDDQRSTTEMLSVFVPASLRSGDIDITIGNKFSGSNALTFRYSEDSLPPIKFTETSLSKDRGVFKLSQIANVKYGPDHRFYFASLDSFVYSAAVAPNLVVSDVCKSDTLGANRSVIGLAFNPAERDVLLYASSSQLFWGDNAESDSLLWANGHVSLLKPGHRGLCLGVVRTIISGLPVSNHDHGVNGLLFDDDGLLHIQVGGATNAGVPAIEVGGIGESPLSGASLIADVSKAGFDGRVLYNSVDPSIARQVGGDVEVYSPGWRNSFELTLHSNGHIYATDNGANSEFGNRSTSCDGVGLPISPYHSDDKLAKVVRGKFGGHANRNRGRDDPIQCVWRSPYDKATNNYNPPIATLQSSTDGLIEYTADLFGGQMKGDLLASKFSTNDPMNNGRLYRIRLDKDGEALGEVDSLFEGSGLSLAMTPWGDLLMPRLYDHDVMVLRANYIEKEGGRLTSVMPFRGPKGGGNEVLVSGTGLNGVKTALFNGIECTSVRQKSETSFVCTVPAGTGSVLVGLLMSNGKVVHSSGGADYRYMRV